jgi:hypothetical protein
MQGNLRNLLFQTFCAKIPNINNMEKGKIDGRDAECNRETGHKEIAAY